MHLYEYIDKGMGKPCGKDHTKLEHFGRSSSGDESDFFLFIFVFAFGGRSTRSLNTLGRNSSGDKPGFFLFVFGGRSIQSLNTWGKICSGVKHLHLRVRLRLRLQGKEFVILKEEWSMIGRVMHDSGTASAVASIAGVEECRNRGYMKTHACGFIKGVGKACGKRHPKFEHFG